MDNRANEGKFLTKFFYGLIGLAASLAFFVTLYWALRLDTSIGTFIGMFKDNTPLYFWPYALLTLGAIVLFGINISFFVYRWRKFGPPKLRTETGGGAGTLIGIATSACPICGSTILAAIGIAGGLAVFPLAGLELKALSLGFLALSIWLIRRDLKKLASALARRDRSACVSGVCPLPQDHSFKDKDRPWLLGLLALTAILAYVAWSMLKTDPVAARILTNTVYGANVLKTDNKLLDELTAKVLPKRGFQSKVRLSDSIVKLVENGVIDQAKFEANYQERGGLPQELKEALVKPSDKPILLTKASATYYVNLLWPLGLTNYMSSNKESPINGKSLFNFASTGGWDLGKEKNGGAYFNKFKIIELTPEQEALVTKIAKNTYRPCCDNSTFFQDCNHGSALLGLLQLGATQELTENELYREALAFNSFWFPSNYIQTALYFKAVKNLDWGKVDPKVIMSKDFSSGSGWRENVDKEVKRLGLTPPLQGGAGCGV